MPVITVDDEVIIGFDRRRLEEALAKARARKPSLGVAVADAAPTTGTEGAYVGRVTPNSPAERAGLRIGDVIIEMAGQPVRNAKDLEYIYASLYPSSRTKLTYLRQGQRIQTELSL
ncbi:MAG: PDZ domain-containing protein [Candidatus Hadarchaeum sp.]